MRSKMSCLLASAAFSWSVMAQVYVPVPTPPINSMAVIDEPKEILAWPIDTQLKNPSLAEKTANFVNDLHGKMTDCELSFSTPGNYHMALNELFFTEFLAKFPADAPLKNYFYTTSPPISPAQIKNGVVQFHNFELTCQPTVVAGPRNVMTTLQNAGNLEGEDPIGVVKNRGNVILVKKGNPKHIKDIWDLGRKNVSIVTPEQFLERGSFSNYASSIYNIALNDMANAPNGMDADKLFNSIFNANNEDEECKNKNLKKCKSSNRRVKWYSGSRIHHREVPWSIAYGKADASVIFYHLALYMVRTFPDKFDIVPLGGTVADPQPMKGNQVATIFIARAKNMSSTDWSDRQKEVREKLIESFQSDEFTTILHKHGLLRP